MRTWIVVLVLVLAVTAVAQSTPAQPPAAGAQQPAAGAASGQPAPPQQKKEIKDPAEYNAYLGAIQQSNDNAKAVALEGFLQQYPNSVVRVDAMENLMATYQKLPGNQAKMLDTAARLVKADPNNLRGLVLLAYMKRQAADLPSLTEAQQYAQAGLQALQTATKPEGTSDADFQKLKDSASSVFHGVLGMVALQSKDYAAAQQNLQASVTANPANISDVYPLALAYLQAPQPNYPMGIWYIARAAALASQSQAPAAQIAQITRYGRSAYVKYHGNEEGWDQVLQMAAANPTPPADFAIKPRPTPAEEAQKLADTKPVKDMSFDEFQLIFTSGNQQAIDKVWSEIKDKPIQFQAKVVEASPTKLTLSATADDIEKNAADVVLNMTAALPVRMVPKVGSMAPVEGTPESYTAQPFMINMGKGMLFGQEKPAAGKPPAAKAPVKKKPAR